jgi:hypothetical protein
LNPNSNKATYKEYFGCFGLCSVWWFVFFDFFTPFTLGGRNYFNSIPFLMIFNALDMSIGGIQGWTPKIMEPFPWIRLGLSA